MRARGGAALDRANTSTTRATALSRRDATLTTPRTGRSTYTVLLRRQDGRAWCICARCSAGFRPEPGRLLYICTTGIHRHAIFHAGATQVGKSAHVSHTWAASTHLARVCLRLARFLHRPRLPIRQRLPPSVSIDLRLLWTVAAYARSACHTTREALIALHAAPSRTLPVLAIVARPPSTSNLIKLAAGMTSYYDVDAILTDAQVIHVPSHYSSVRCLHIRSRKYHAPLSCPSLR